MRSAYDVRKTVMARPVMNIAILVLALLTVGPIGCSRNNSAPSQEVKAIQISLPAGVPPSGAEQQLAATGTLGDGSTRDITGVVTWSSSNSRVATVAQNGLVSTHGKGVTTISATVGTITDRMRFEFEAERAGFAYVAVHDANTIAIFKIDPETGLLSEGGRVSTPGVGPRYLEFDPTGAFLFVDFDLSNEVAGYAVDPVTGALTLVAGTPVPTGTSPKNITTDPAGKFLYLSNAVSNDVSGYAITNGTLTEIPGSPFATGLIPYGLTVNGTGQFLYVTNRDSDNVTAYAIDPVTGSLAPLPGSPFAAGDGPRDITLSDSGEFAYIPNRFSNDITVYRVDPVTGMLGQVAGSPFPAGTDPRSVELDASGLFLYAGNTVSNDIRPENFCTLQTTRRMM